MSVIRLETFTPLRSMEYYELSHSSDDIRNYLPELVKDTAESSSRLVQNFSSYNFLTDFAFLITNKIKAPVGAIFASQDPAFHALDVAFFLGGQHRRKGYMKDAMKMFSNYIRSNTPYRYLLFDVRIDDKVSQSFLASLGARNLGVSEFYPFGDYLQYELKVK